jgi:2-haloacid dehalogenase
MDRPAVVVFDVNETLSDLHPLADRFADVGAPRHLAPTWFAGVLRDGFALTAVGDRADFAEIGRGVLRPLLDGVPLDRDPDAAVEHVLTGFLALPVHPDVPDGVRAMAGDGLRLVTLSNGSAAVAEALLGSAGLREAFERLLSVQEAGVWKPVAAAYAFAARECGVAPEQMLLVAVHPWDVHGAHRAGLRTAWVDRAGSGAYPGHFDPPDLVVRGIDELARELGVRPAPRPG